MNKITETMNNLTTSVLQINATDLSIFYVLICITFHSKNLDNLKNIRALELNSN